MGSGQNIKIFNQGDLIEWEFENEHEINLFGKTHQAEIAAIDLEDKCYCVYASYGQDKIPFNQAKKV